MNFKLLGSLLLSMCLTTSVYGYNANRLAFETETYVARIFSNIPSLDGIEREEEMIRGSLSFLGDDEGQYIQPGSFQALYEQSTNEIKNYAFMNFSKACLNLYEDFEKSSNTRKQVSVHMLFENVKAKFAEQLKRDERFDRLRRQSESSAGLSKDARAEADRMLDFFVNIDRGAAIVTQ